MSSDHPGPSRPADATSPATDAVRPPTPDGRPRGGPTSPTRPFGRLTYATLTVALAVLAGLGLRDQWPSWREHRRLAWLAGELRDPSPLVHRHAADELVRAGAPALPRLVEAASDADAGVRLLAFSALGRTAPVPGPTLPTLVAGLRDPDLRIRRQAADALGRLGPGAAATLGALERAMADPDPELRLKAAAALSRIGGRAGVPAVGVLLALLTDPDPDHIPERTEVLPALRRLGPTAEAGAVMALISLVGADEPRVRRAAIECLEWLGRAAVPAVPSLERALDGEDRVARCLAASALSEILGWERGPARAVLGGLLDGPPLPARVEEQVRRVLSAPLVGGSEIWQPVHTVRSVGAELRRLESRTGPAVGSVDVEEIPGRPMPAPREQ